MSDPTHTDDPTLVEELLDQIEDGRSAPLHERIAVRDSSNGIRCVDPRDDHKLPLPGPYCSDVCIVGPVLLERAADRLSELEEANEIAETGWEAARATIRNLRDRVVAERRRADEWESRALQAERQTPETTDLERQRDNLLLEVGAVKRECTRIAKKRDEFRGRLGRATDTINHLLEAGVTLAETRERARRVVEELSR